MLLRRTLAAAAALVVPLALGACSSSGSSGGSTSSDASGAITIYTTTNVWGSVAQHVGGDDVDVVSSITDPSQDPHDYNATAKDKADADKAAIVVVNGGGYDDWGTELADNSSGDPALIDAVDVSGVKAEQGEELNEHVFYSIDAADKVAEAIEKELAGIDPDNAATYEKNADAFEDQLGTVEDAAETFKKDHPGLKAVATEPVVGYLLEDMGIENITPEEFVEQSETEAGPSVKATKETTDLVSGGSTNLLVLNAQTEDEISTNLERTADASNVPVVKVYETFPEGTTDYIDFIKDAEKDLEAAAA